MAYKKETGIYMIQSVSRPERIYIGSAVVLGSRKERHLHDLRNNKHHSPQLQRHFDKYGEADLEFSVIESGEYLCKQHLLSREQGWLIHFRCEDTDKPYFNNEKIAGNSTGRIVSDVTREKCRTRMLGNQNCTGKHWTLPKEFGIRQGLRQLGANNPNFGNHGTAETNKKKSDSHKGLKHSEETIIKMRNVANKAMDNYVVKESTKELISIANKGENNPMFGKHMTEDAKLRTREMRYLTKFINELEKEQCEK